MASKHEAIKIQVISDWSVAGRGRLFIMTQGTFRAMYSDAVVRVSPYPKKQSGFPDLFGYEVVSGKPIFCTVEVKTIGDSVKPDQRDFMNWAITQGIHCYVAHETYNLGGYYLEKWSHR